MSLRLTFLYPQLLRTSTLTARSGYRAAAAGRTSRRAVSSSSLRGKSGFAPRHGKAVEPTWEKEDEGKTEGEGAQDNTPAEKTLSGIADASIKANSSTAAEEGKASQVTTDAAASSAPELETKAAASPASTVSTASSTSSPPPSAKPSEETAKSDKDSTATPAPASSPSVSAESVAGPAVNAVLHMPSPAPENIHHPHMAPPPYVHHFDSYSMTKRLEEGGYTREQATTAMKAIRKLLAENLDVAQRSLVSKSDVENETYLFSAACSELSTEITKNRRLQEEQMRQQRIHLQHEVDILTQSLNQELMTLTDNVRGMFNDRKMTAREEQKEVESAIQKINYKMSILLSSDSKSEIEGVRWVLIRRSVVGILFMAVLTLGMIRYATYVGQQRKKEADRRKKERERLKREREKAEKAEQIDNNVAEPRPAS